MMTDNESKQNSLKQLAKIAPIVRGLLAEPTGKPDIPYDPVILKSLTNKEAVDFAGSANNAQASEYPAPLTKDQGLPLYIDALDIDSPPEELRKKLSDSIADYSAQYNSKPQIICLRNLGILWLIQV